MKSQSQYILVTTKHRGVFAGELITQEGDKVTLANARNAIRFGTTRGFLELADSGPTGKSKIGAAAILLELYDVTSVAECSATAEKAWREA